MKKQYLSDGVDPKAQIITTCRQCKKGFKTKNRRQRYCTYKCRDYYNNHKGVKSRYKKDDPYQKNLEILHRICKDKDYVQVDFKRLMEFGFELGLPCKVIQTMDGWLWSDFDGYCVSQRRKSEFWFFLGPQASIPKDDRPTYQKLLSGSG